jgi:hypothetical protein
MSTAYAVNKTYGGLDVSLKDTAVRIVDDAGKIVFEGKLSSDPAVIAKCLERAGLESGMTSPWLWSSSASWAHLSSASTVAMRIACYPSIAVARKLAIILHAIWRNDTVFEWQTTEALAA